MKKIFFTLLITCCFFGIANIKADAASTTQTKVSNTAQLRIAINKYKMKNYVGCIQDIGPILKKDPSNAVAYYYAASAYMKIGNKDRAIEEFDKVINLNTIPALTSYSIQAKNCINGVGKCEYVKLNEDQVTELLKEPETYISKMQEGKQNSLTPDNMEIERLIKGKYNSSIHPEANRIIIDTLLKQEKHDMNVSAEKYKSEAPTNDEIANAVKVLARAGINPIQQNRTMPSYTAPTMQPFTNFNQNNESAYLSMMLGNNQNNQQNNNNFMNMLPFLVQQQNGNPQMNTEMVQAMMMSQMMPDFNFDNNNKN